jgi:hypothetical protein
MERSLVVPYPTSRTDFAKPSLSADSSCTHTRQDRYERAAFTTGCQWHKQHCKDATALQLHPLHDVEPVMLTEGVNRCLHRC